MRKKLIIVTTMVLCASVVYAGTAGYEYVRSEDLTMLGIEVGNVSYDFSGNAEVPFTLSGTQATVYLAIYTKDQATPVVSAARADPNGTAATRCSEGRGSPTW